MPEDFADDFVEDSIGKNDLNDGFGYEDEDGEAIADLYSEEDM